ncbi:MAG: hypothetical protein WAL77_08825 [Candidatus Dormiibacterota bacterium]
MAAQSAGEAMRGESVMLDDVYAAEIQRLVALGTVLAGDGVTGRRPRSRRLPSTGPARPPRPRLPAWAGVAVAAHHGGPARDAAPSRLGARAAPSRTRVAAGAE